MSVTIKQRILTNNDCFKSGRTITPNSMQLHTIGTAQNTAESLAQYWNQSGIQACVHYCVDAETAGLVLQFLPDNRRSWADAGTGNNNSITVELMESDFMKYSGGANYTVTDEAKFKADVTRAYNTAVEFFAMKCKEYGWNPKEKMANGLHRVYSHDEGRRLGLSSAHVDPTHIWNRYGWTMDKFRDDVSKAMGTTPKQTTSPAPYRVRKTWEDASSQIGSFDILANAKNAADSKPGYIVFDSNGNKVYQSGMTDIQKKNFEILATLPDYKGIPKSKEDYILKVAEICVKLYPYTKILPSVVIGQSFIENGGGIAGDAKVLTQNNNLIGIKSSLLNSTWQDYSVWDGRQILKNTPEVYGGVATRIDDYFRVYSNYAESILDYEMFLTHVKSGGDYKYRAVVGMTDPKAVITYIHNKGYATSPVYAESVMRVINQYDLTKYDREAGVTESKVIDIDRYRVAKDFKDGKPVEQLGAFSVLDNAKMMATTNPGYYVFDAETGKRIFPTQVAPTVEMEFYRVATDYKSGKYVNQVGAYTEKANAINAAKEKGGDYKVYSPDGQVIYSAPKTPAKDIYAVRRTLKNVDSQIGLFSDINNAKKLADERWGYNVYNIETNKPVYKPVLMNWQKVCASAIELGEEVLKDIAAGYAWEYAGSGERTFAKARKKGVYKANCSGGVYWILRNAGVIPDSYSCNWYGTIGGFKWLTATARAEARKYFDIIDIHTKTVNQCIKDGTLRPGDIICYETFSHTNMYLGNNTSFDSGHNNCHGSGNGAKFYRWVSPLTCGGYKIAQIMRIKETNTSQYRVQAGSYLLKDNANNMMAKVKDKGFDAKIVTVNGEYVVQLGVFSSRANADTLAANAGKAGIVCLVNKI